MLLRLAIGVGLAAGVSWGALDTLGTAGAAATNSFVVTGTSPYGPTSETITENASASYGHLYTSLTETAVNNPVGAVTPGYHALATAEFTDTLTIYGGSGAGFIEYSLNGATTGASDLGAAAYDLTQNGQDAASQTWSDTSGYKPINITTAPIPIIFGSSFVLDLSADTETWASPGDFNAFSYTDLGISSIEVFDLNMHPVDFSMTSTSGEFITESGQFAPAPEPTSIILFAPVLMLAGLACYRRLHHSRSSN